MRNSITQTLSEYIAKTRFTDIPVGVLQDAKDLILDSIGCTIGGFTIQPGKIVVDLFIELGGRPEATILATGKKLPCIYCAYVNAYLGNLLDFDDTCSVAFGHPGTTIIPPGLAVAEKIRASGKDFISAVVTAYEVWARISQSITPSPDRRAKVWGLGTHQIFGAAVVSSKLLKLDVKQISNMLGIAGTTAPVPSTQKMGIENHPVSWLKSNYGWASMGGVLSALLAERGFVDSKDIFGGEKGFWIMAGSDHCAFEKLTQNLGTEYTISRTGFKPYASCRATHTSIEATARIMARHGIDVNKVKSIRVSTFSELVEAFGDSKPTSILDAQFSLPHLIALELSGRSPSMGLSEANLTDPGVESIAQKVSMELSPEINERFKQNKKFRSAVLTIEQLDGSSFSERVDIPKWDPETRPSRKELQAKFAALTVPVIGGDASRAIMDDIEQLENLTDVSTMLSRLRRGGRHK